MTDQPQTRQTRRPCAVHRTHVPPSRINEVHHVWPLGDDGPDIPDNRVVDDDQFGRLFPGLTGNPRLHPLWSLLCSSISVHLSQASGLPVDFQIQGQTVANEKFGGERRIPLGLFPQT
jgi:hypothetical protein